MTQLLKTSTRKLRLPRPTTTTSPTGPTSAATHGSTTTTAKVYVCFDAGNAASEGDVIELGADEAINLKFKDGLDVANVHAATSTGTVRGTVAAIIDDV